MTRYHGMGDRNERRYQLFLNPLPFPRLLRPIPNQPLPGIRDKNPGHVLPVQYPAPLPVIGPIPAGPVLSPDGIYLTSSLQRLDETILTLSTSSITVSGTTICNLYSVRENRHNTHRIALWA